MFIAAAEGSNTIAYSYDGKSWASTVVASLQRVFVANSIGTAFAFGTNNIYRSTDGVSWVTCSPPAGSWLGAAWSPEKQLLVACNGASSTNNFLLSSDKGLTWTIVTGATTAINRMCWAPWLGMFIAAGSVMHSSRDGKNWVRRSLPSGIASAAAVFAIPELRLLVMTSVSGTGVATSNDGYSWSTYNGPSTAVYALAYSPKLRRIIGSHTPGASTTCFRADIP
jgi:hypothetical protein